MKNKITLGAIVIIAVLVVWKIGAQSQPAPDFNQELIKSLRAQLASANETIQQLSADAARGRHLPVSVKQRKALTGDGFVVVVQNESTHTLPVNVILSSANFGKTNSYPLVLSPAHITGMPKEIGYKEGWTGAPGDAVHIESVGFDPINVQLSE